MGEEINNNKIYFKDEDGNIQEISGTEGLKAEPLIEDETIPTAKNILGHELTCSIPLKKSDILRFRKTIGYNILKPKRFKKLLMSIGFDRNEAEQINKFFVYNHEPRYEYYIDLYSDNVKNMRYVLEIWR